MMKGSSWGSTTSMNAEMRCLKMKINFRLNWKRVCMIVLFRPQTSKVYVYLHSFLPIRTPLYRIVSHMICTTKSGFFPVFFRLP